MDIKLLHKIAASVGISAVLANGFDAFGARSLAQNAASQGIIMSSSHSIALIGYNDIKIYSLVFGKNEGGRNSNPIVFVNANLGVAIRAVDVDRVMWPRGARTGGRGHSWRTVHPDVGINCSGTELVLLIRTDYDFDFVEVPLERDFRAVPTFDRDRTRKVGRRNESHKNCVMASHQFSLQQHQNPSP